MKGAKTLDKRRNKGRFERYSGKLSSFLQGPRRRCYAATA